MATQTGTINANETGEAEILLPWRPTEVEAEFSDGLSDTNEANCSDMPPDEVFVAVRTDQYKIYISVRWEIGKPRKITWTATQ